VRADRYKQHARSRKFGKHRKTRDRWTESSILVGRQRDCIGRRTYPLSESAYHSIAAGGVAARRRLSAPAGAAALPLCRRNPFRLSYAAFIDLRMARSRGADHNRRMLALTVQARLL
jgi:hypothetical protein